MTHTEIIQAPVLTGTENQLLEVFRQLNDDGQTACLAVAKSLLLTFAKDKIIPLSLFDEGR